MAQESTGYKFYEKVARDASGNVAFAFIGLGVIWLLAKVWPVGAKGAFWLAAAVMALSVVHFVVVLSAGVISQLFGTIAKNERWIWGAAAVRLVEQLSMLTALWIAARVVGYLH